MTCLTNTRQCVTHHIIWSWTLTSSLVRYSNTFSACSNFITYKLACTHRHTVQVYHMGQTCSSEASVGMWRMFLINKRILSIIIISSSSRHSQSCEKLSMATLVKYKVNYQILLQLHKSNMKHIAIQRKIFEGINFKKLQIRKLIFSSKNHCKSSKILVSSINALLGKFEPQKISRCTVFTFWQWSASVDPNTCITFWLANACRVGREWRCRHMELRLHWLLYKTSSSCSLQWTTSSAQGLYGDPLDWGIHCQNTSKLVEWGWPAT